MYKVMPIAYDIGVTGVSGVTGDIGVTGVSGGRRCDLVWQSI